MGCRCSRRAVTPASSATDNVHTASKSWMADMVDDSEYDKYVPEQLKLLSKASTAYRVASDASEFGFVHPAQCTSCGRTLQFGDRFCEQCGEEVQEPLPEPVSDPTRCTSCSRRLQPGDQFCERCGEAVQVPVPEPVFSSSTPEVAVDPKRPACDCGDADCADEEAGKDLDVTPGGGLSRFDVRVDIPIRTRPGFKPGVFIHDQARTIETKVEDDQQPAFSVLWDRVSSTHRGTFKAYMKARVGSDGLLYIDTLRLLKRSW